jgi:hypothetical protein
VFLAVPAIFCASATLIEKHERDRKQKLGLSGSGGPKLLPLMQLEPDWEVSVSVCLVSSYGGPRPALLHLACTRFNCVAAHLHRFVAVEARSG